MGRFHGINLMRYCKCWLNRVNQSVFTLCSHAACIHFRQCCGNGNVACFLQICNSRTFANSNSLRVAHRVYPIRACSMLTSCSHCMIAWCMIVSATGMEGRDNHSSSEDARFTIISVVPRNLTIVRCCPIHHWGLMISCYGKDNDDKTERHSELRTAHVCALTNI